jgi:fumarate hydratase class II
MTMVCSQVMGNNTAVSVAGSNGQFEVRFLYWTMENVLLTFSDSSMSLSLS